MATVHQLSVITNNCYKPPVNPENGLSASLNERTTLGVTSRHYHEDSEEDSDQEKQSVFGVDNVNNSALSGTKNSTRLFNQTDSYLANMTSDLAGLDDSEFYKRLTDLKNEHKKTLELCEKMYQEKVGDAYSMAQTTPQQDSLVKSAEYSPGFGMFDRERTKNEKNVKNTAESRSREQKGIARDTIELDPDMKLDASFGKPPIAPTSHIRTSFAARQSLKKSYEEPRSARSIASAWSERSDGEDRFWQAMSGYSSEADRQGDETMRKSYSANDYLNYVKSVDDSERNSPLSQIENMWDKFSVDDYALRRSEMRKRSNSMSKFSKFSSTDRKTTRPFSATSVEWRNRVTVPKPFNMTLRESLKEKPRSRNMEEYEQQERERREREEEECQRQFKATPIPAHVYMPLYKEIMDERESRRQEVRQASVQLTKSMEKPFKFMKREEQRRRQSHNKIRPGSAAQTDKGQKKTFKAKPFKAKPYPAHLFLSSTEDQMLEEEEYRKIRVQMRAEDMLRKSQLPATMASRRKDYFDENHHQKQRTDKGKRSRFHNEFKFQPKVNDYVPDFDELHRDFHKDMARRKSAKEATVCKPFKLRTAQVVRKKHQELEDYKPDDDSLLRSSLNRNSTLSSSFGTSTLSRSLDAIPTKMTASAELRSSANRKKLNDAAQRELKEMEEERKQLSKEKHLKKIVAQKAAANDTRPSLKETNQLKMKEFRLAEKARLEEYRKQLHEMKERVQQRPLLFERASQENAARAAERRYRDTLQRAGLSEDFIVKKGSRAPSATASHRDNADADDATSDASYSQSVHTQSKQQASRSESRKYSEDFDDDDATSAADKSPDNSDIEEDLPTDD